MTLLLYFSIDSNIETPNNSLGNFSAKLTFEKPTNNKTNMMSVFFIPNFCTTSTRRSKSRNHQKVNLSARSFARSFRKSVGFSS